MIARVLFALAVICAVVGAENVFTYSYFKDSVELEAVADKYAADVRLGIESGKAGIGQFGEWAVASGEELGRAMKGANGKAGVGKYYSRVFKGKNGSELIVGSRVQLQFGEGVSKGRRESIMADAGLVILDDRELMRGYYLCESCCADSDAVLALTNMVAKGDELIFCEPELISSGGGLGDYVPDSTNCWALENDGSRYGEADIDLDATLAWDYTCGSDEVVVVVFDVGIDLGHPDLNVAYARDFTSDGGDGGIVNASYDRHGTAVAGCINAQLNGMGTTGIAPGCKLASARTMRGTSTSGSWTASSTWLVYGLVWARDIGAKVTVNSNYYNSPSSAIASAYDSTRNSGLIHFASAGNESVASLSFPGSVASVNAVSAVDTFGNLAGFSSYGNGLAYAAPGMLIYSTDISGAGGYSSGDYVFMEGTSFSCPLAAGVAALVLSVDGGLGAEEVEGIMGRSATDLGEAGYDTRYGYGMVNAYHAVVLADSGACQRSDINRDHMVDMADVAALAVGYGVGGDSMADLDCSGGIGLGDMELLVSMWLTSDR